MLQIYNFIVNIFVTLFLFTWKVSGRNPYIRTYTGRKVYMLNPRPEDIDIQDIAISLSRECRFGNHTKEFYSVAQHCLVSSYCSDDVLTSLVLLLHDSTEGYVRDIPRPLKILLPVYQRIEKRFEDAIYSRFGISNTDIAKVKKAVKVIDMRLCITEAYRFMDHPEDHIPAGYAPYEIQIEPLSSNEAHELFIARYNDLVERFKNHR